MKKILCLFDYKANTGFATVSQNIVPRIKKIFGEKIELHIIAINYFGDPIYENGILVLSAVKSASKHDDFGRFGFLKVLKESNEYDGIFIIQDIEVISPIIPILKNIKDQKKAQNQKSFKSIFYFPVDCQLAGRPLNGLEFFDLLITYTEYGRSEVLKVRPELKGRIKVVPHGTDADNFYPVSNTESSEFRASYFGENKDKFIIMNLNRNQPRKDIPNTILAFAQVKGRWAFPKKPFLYLHCNPNDPMGHRLYDIANQLGLKEGEDYMFPPQGTENHGTDLKTINLIYNSVDLYVTTTLGEGWGLAFTEAAAVLLPIICPNHTSFMEMSANGARAFVIDHLHQYVNSIDNTIRLKTDVDDVANSILLVSEAIIDTDNESGSVEALLERTNAAYRWAKKLNWDYVADIWKKYFEETYNL